MSCIFARAGVIASRSDATTKASNSISLSIADAILNTDEMLFEPMTQNANDAACATSLENR